MSNAEIKKVEIILRSDSYMIGCRNHSVILIMTSVGVPTGVSATAYTVMTMNNNGYGDWTPLRIRSYRRQSAAKAAFKKERNRLSTMEIEKWVQYRK